MTNKSERRKFLKAALVKMAGIVGIGLFSSGTVLGATARERTPRRFDLLRRFKRLVTESKVPKPEDTSPPIFSLDDPSSQHGKTRLYNQFSQERIGVFHENQEERKKLYDLVSPIPSEDNATNNRTAEREDLIERLKKLEPPTEVIRGAHCYYR